MRKAWCKAIRRGECTYERWISVQYMTAWVILFGGSPLFRDTPDSERGVLVLGWVFWKTYIKVGCEPYILYHYFV